MNFEQIMTIVIAIAPAFTAIVTVVTAAIRLLKSDNGVIAKLEELKKEIYSTKEYSDLKNELKIAYQENRELKKKLNELLTKIDRIHRED